MAPDESLMINRIWGTAAIVTVVLLYLLQSYEWLEKTQVVLVGVLLGCIFVAAAITQPDWQAALYGMIVPQIPAYPLGS